MKNPLVIVIVSREARLNNVRTCVVTTTTTDSLEPYYTRVDVEQLNNRRKATPPTPFSFNHQVVIIKGFHNSHRDGAGAASRFHCSSPSHLSSFFIVFITPFSLFLVHRAAESLFNFRQKHERLHCWLRSREIELKASQKALFLENYTEKY